MMDEQKNEDMLPERSTLDMLVCPLTKTRLTLSDDRRELVSYAGRVAFPIRGGIPLLCIEEARPLRDEEISAAK